MNPMYISAQIEATQQNLEPPSEQKPPQRSDGLNVDLAKHLSNLAFKLALTEDEHNVGYDDVKSMLYTNRLPNFEIV